MSVALAIVGGGGFGQGLAAAAAREGRECILFSRRKLTIDAPKVRVAKELREVAEAELVLIAMPSEHVAPLARELGAFLDGSHLVAHVSRGLVGDGLETLSHVIRSNTPVRRIGVLAGPLSADALAKGIPSGGIVGSRFPEVARAVLGAIGGARVRLYSTDDIVGVEIASAMVGLLALAAGFAQGIGLGPSTLAILGTRGLAESARIGVALGADEKTFHGLAGVGDLMSALGGDDRPESRLGRALAGGKSLDEAGRAAGANIEGVSIAGRVARFAKRAGIEMPITDAVAAMLAGEMTPGEAIEVLMTRRTGSES